MVRNWNSEEFSQITMEEHLELIKFSGGNHNNLVDTIEYQNGLHLNITDVSFIDICLSLAAVDISLNS